MPAETADESGVCTVTRGIFARPCLHCSFNSWMRRATRAFPIAWWKRNASGNAQRCSNEWKPPGVIDAAAGISGSRRHIRSKLGMVGLDIDHANGFAHRTPVPRGPKIHLWQPAANMSHPSELTVSSSTPKPCTPSTQRMARSCSARPRLAAATTWAKRAIGVRTPVPEWTQVTATTRVAGRISCASASAIWSGSAALGRW